MKFSTLLWLSYKIWHFSSSKQNLTNIIERDQIAQKTYTDSYNLEAFFRDSLQTHIFICRRLESKNPQLFSFIDSIASLQSLRLSLQLSIQNNRYQDALLHKHAQYLRLNHT